MSETSPDGVLAVHPERDNQLSIAFPLEGVGQEIAEQLVSGDGNSGIDLAGRSAAGQLGIDVIRAVGATVVFENQLIVPIGIEAHTPTAKSIAEDIGELQNGTPPGGLIEWDGEDIKFGRLVNYNDLKRLGKDEIEKAISEHLIVFDPTAKEGENSAYQVNDDGSVSLPLSLLQFVFNEQMFRDPEQRFNALHHGRAGLIPHMDTVGRQEDDVLPEFMVGGIVFSPGPYYVKIRESIDQEGRVRQLPSASLFDGNRLMGVNPRHDPYSRNRQVELVNQDGLQTFGETWVTVDIFRSQKISETLHPVIDWRSMSIPERQKTHHNGVSPLDVIKATDPASREFLLGPVSGPEAGALVISSHGISQVPRGSTPRFMAQNIRTAAESFGRYRDIPNGLEHLEPFVEALKPAADRSRLVIAEELELRHIPSIVKSGDVRALLMRRYLGSGAKGIAMTKEDHSAIVDLVRRGVSVAWENDGDLREMHRSGLWLTPEAADRIEELDLVIAMYGSHFGEVSQGLEPQIDQFFGQLTDLMPVDNLGVTHGNMGGLMALTDRLGRKHGMMSLGVGLDLSDVGQDEVNLSCDGFLFLESHERLYRQEKLDKFNTISVFNEGGYGTLEEFFITICSHKLSSCLPGPNILIAQDGLYEDAKRLIEKIADEGLGQKWIPGTIELLESYEEAAAIIKRFWENPAEYWKKAGIPSAAIAVAYQKHLDLMDQMGMRLAGTLVRAAESYTA